MIFLLVDLGMNKLLPVGINVSKICDGCFSFIAGSDKRFQVVEICNQISHVECAAQLQWYLSKILPLP